MSRFHNLHDWKKGNIVGPRGSHLQEAVEAIRSIAKSLGMDLVEARAPQLGFRWLGKIVSAGANGDADFPATDCRYWVQRMVPQGETSDLTKAVTLVEHKVFEPGIYPVTSLFDQQFGAKTMGVGRIVEVDGWQDLDGFTRWVTTTTFPLRVKLTDVSTYAAKGWYKAKVWIPRSTAIDFDPASDLTEANLGTAGADCLAAYPTEIGASVKYLDLALAPLILSALPLPKQSDGTPVVQLVADQSELCVVG